MLNITDSEDWRIRLKFGCWFLIAFEFDTLRVCWLLVDMKEISVSDGIIIRPSILVNNDDVDGVLKSIVNGEDMSFNKRNKMLIWSKNNLFVWYLYWVILTKYYPWRMLKIHYLRQTKYVLPIIGAHKGVRGHNPKLISTNAFLLTNMLFLKKI